VKTIGNLIWFVLAGLWMALAYILIGIINLFFIVTIPFSIQCFKLAGYTLWPFGRAVVRKQGSQPGVRTVGNFLWFFTGGIWLALGHLITGALLCLTVIGVPFGVVSFRMARLAMTPFGKEIVDARSPEAAHAEVVVAALSA
jgi:uncharacterized membrane protein YccF (DUF307 family)